MCRLFKYNKRKIRHLFAQRDLLHSPTIKLSLTVVAISLSRPCPESLSPIDKNHQRKQNNSIKNRKHDEYILQAHAVHPRTYREDKGERDEVTDDGDTHHGVRDNLVFTSLAKTWIFSFFPPPGRLGVVCKNLHQCTNRLDKSKQYCLREQSRKIASRSRRL